MEGSIISNKRPILNHINEYDIFYFFVKKRCQMHERLKVKNNRKINQPVSSCKPLIDRAKNTMHSPKPFEDRNNGAAKTEKGKLITESTV